MFSTASSATGAGWSTSPAEPPAEQRPDAGPGSVRPRSLWLTRRTLLASTTALPVLAAIPALAADGPRPFDRGEPFDDGTFFDDGYGWVD